MRKYEPKTTAEQRQDLNEWARRCSDVVAGEIPQFHRVTEVIADLTTCEEMLVKTSGQFVQEVVDSCESDRTIREEARMVLPATAVYGDSHGVPDTVEIVKLLVKQLMRTNNLYDDLVKHANAVGFACRQEACGWCSTGHTGNVEGK